MEKIPFRTAASGIVVVAAFAVVGMMAVNQLPPEGIEATQGAELAASVAGMGETAKALEAKTAEADHAEAPSSSVPQTPAPQNAATTPAQPGGRIVWVPVLIPNPTYYRPVIVAPRASAYSARAYPGYSQNAYRTTPYQAGSATQPSLGALYRASNYLCSLSGWFTCEMW